ARAHHRLEELAAEFIMQLRAARKVIQKNRADYFANRARCLSAENYVLAGVIAFANITVDRANHVNLPAGKIALQRQDRLGRSTSSFHPVNIPTLKSLRGSTVWWFQQPTFGA